MLFHGSARENPVSIPFVALPFARMFDRRTGRPKFESRDALCSDFKISADAGIVLSGVDVDKAIEGWWRLERGQRITLLKHLRTLGMALITSPNFSLFVDQPRWDDLHSIKRIVITHQEILDQGIRAALHVNGRTDTDFRRWTDYLLKRPEIDTLAYEFTTGPG
jgi:hypothetical protein